MNKTEKLEAIQKNLKRDTREIDGDTLKRAKAALYDIAASAKHAATVDRMFTAITQIDAELHLMMRAGEIHSDLGAGTQKENENV